jgi:hypothetical protein
MNNEFMNDRLSLERRLIIVERIAQESLENIKHSQEIMNSHISHHPMILSLNNSLKESLSLIEDVTKIKDDLRSLNNEFLKMQSTSVKLDDFLLVKEKLMKCDHIITDKLPDLFDSVKKLMDFSNVVNNKVSGKGIDSCLRH